MSSLKTLFGAAAPLPPAASTASTTSALPTTTTSTAPPAQPQHKPQASSPAAASSEPADAALSPSKAPVSIPVHKTPRSPSMATVEEDEEASAITLAFPTSSPTSVGAAAAARVEAVGSSPPKRKGGGATASINTNTSTSTSTSTNSNSNSNSNSSSNSSSSNGITNTAPFSKPSSSTAPAPAPGMKVDTEFDCDLIDASAVGTRGSFATPSPMPPSEGPAMSLSEIIAELQPLMDAANAGRPFDENRLDYLLRRQEENPEYRAEVAEKLALWRAEHGDFLQESLEITRSFVPPTIFSDTMLTLTSPEVGLSEDISKRILQKKSLWLVRMSQQEIARLHEADLYGRYNATLLDVVELAAVYHVLPDRFLNDPVGKKVTWKENIQDNLKGMLAEKAAGVLPRGKCRAMCYENYCNGTNFASLSPMVRSGVPSPVPNHAGSTVPAVSSSVFEFSDKTAEEAGDTKSDGSARASPFSPQPASSSTGAGPMTPLSKRGSTKMTYAAFNSATMDPINAGNSKFGPITDLTSVRKVEVSASSRGSTGPRRSFTEICKTHGILGRKNSV